MKKIFLILSILTLGLCGCNGQKSFSEKTLSMKLVDINNSEVVFKNVLAKHKGKTIVIEIWASWCGDCVKAMPQMKELQAKNPDVVYLFISMDKEYVKWTEGIEKHSLKGEHIWVNDPELMKGEFGKSLKVNWIPRYMVVDKNQKIVLFKAIETDFDKINETLKNLN